MAYELTKYLAASKQFLMQRKLYITKCKIINKRPGSYSEENHMSIH